MDVVLYMLSGLGHLQETHPRYSKANQNQETEASLEKQGNFSAEIHLQRLTAKGLCLLQITENR